METWDAYRSRRNVRTYTDQPLSDEVLTQILEAGRRSPSAFNSQPWDFVIVRTRQALVELTNVWQGAGHVGRSAATVVIVTPEQADTDKARWSEFDLGQALMAIAIVATDLGVGSAHAIVGDSDLCREQLGIPTGYRCAYLLALGYPEDGPLKPLLNPKRRPYDEVVHFDRW